MKLEEQRNKMKEDILKKKNEMKSKGNDIKFELVGLPPDMLSDASASSTNDQDEKPFEMALSNK